MTAICQQHLIKNIDFFYYHNSIRKLLPKWVYLCVYTHTDTHTHISFYFSFLRHNFLTFQSVGKPAESDYYLTWSWFKFWGLHNMLVQRDVTEHSADLLLLDFSVSFLFWAELEFEPRPINTIPSFFITHYFRSWKVKGIK